VGYSVDDALIDYRFIHVNVVGFLDPFLESEIFGQGCFPRTSSSNDQIDFRVCCLLVKTAMVVEELGIMIL
jgi:hypothetical protein